MEFPSEIFHTSTKDGARIVRVHGIAHECAKPEYGRSRDMWWFIGDLDFGDGKIMERMEIPPYALCPTEDNRDEVLALSEELSAYLRKFGKWYGRDSKHEGWYANERPKIRRRA